ncbi:leucyl aminopeptidase [Methylococcaceae bacterium CS1]|uniref:leucyl aminopeptidase n=1 Tax=Bathymodiolus platifrons methanotrophic gill symbiont TaxID=113268 RepID=UPI000B407701|nr:leucyl aminopeptidase [Bathymodiolus platifrons methanotrophic gill symbiont]MCK5869680.1 leucyl aminopeptidase [Methyloprofundus sp.]TXK98153.1 leucyl aminopeptidase [Methylococcaceae bacterium CS4]TXK99651.1 leucyl aminopeptidase [Methylococcaceae bacterium CS5]TXL04659.1 leucyl aminopeptidase [Methylococcaceae bacterium CS1]TXL08026.1 leucyl aminopeptidase [Methylococcaceae bacterium CS3]TXL11842.1 leucyl aminopeptidase [Methylococcaceae bacterium CS2]
MDYLLANTPIEKLESECLIVAIFEENQLSPAAQTLDSLTDGLISNILTRGDIKGKVADTLLINYLPHAAIKRALLVGLGDKNDLSSKKYRKAVAAAANTLKATQIKSADCCLVENQVTGQNLTWNARHIVEAFDAPFYQFNDCKSKPAAKLTLTSISLHSETDAVAIQAGLDQGLAIAQGVALTKHVSDLPGNICTPTYLAEQAIEIAKQHKNLSAEILEEADMQKLGMGSFLSVSRGSRQPAKLITLEYKGADANTQPIVFVGKGLTFDAGGISLKPGAGMDEMKYDMCGSAAVLGALQAAAQLQLPLNIVGIIPSSENMPDGDANKPGDIVTSMAGLTIEILNTDAEGRLILCDALTYAKKFNPDVVIDMATLTGACLVALGRVPSGLLGNDDTLCNDLSAASETALDSVWRLPLWEEYQDQLKSNFADIANIGGRDAGTITAACFLSRFTKDYKWAHLDIAGTAWKSGDAKGATGRPVPLLVQYLLDRANAA